MRKIVLNTAKAIARDDKRPASLVFTGAGEVLNVPSRGLSAKQADAWIKDGTASAFKR